MGIIVEVNNMELKKNGTMQCRRIQIMDDSFATVEVVMWAKYAADIGKGCVTRLVTVVNGKIAIHAGRKKVLAGGSAIFSVYDNYDKARELKRWYAGGIVDTCINVSTERTFIPIQHKS